MNLFQTGHTQCLHGLHASFMFCGDGKGKQATHCPEKQGPACVWEQRWRMRRKADQLHIGILLLTLLVHSCCKLYVLWLVHYMTRGQWFYNEWDENLLGLTQSQQGAMGYWSEKRTALLFLRYSGIFLQIFQVQGKIASIWHSRQADKNMIIWMAFKVIWTGGRQCGSSLCNFWLTYER